MIRAIHMEHEVPSLHAIVISQRSVEVDGLKDPEEDEDPYQPRAGWQSKAARKVEARSFARLLGTLTDAQKALLQS